MISRLLTRYSSCFAALILVMALHAPAHAGGNMRQAFNADIPSSLWSSQGEEMLSLGYLDVTKPPYSADNSGTTDVTQALQEAIYDAYRYNLVTWFPKGTYLVSDQLSMIQQPNGLPGLKTGKSQRKYANILQGDSTDGHFPTIRLADNSQVQDNTLLVFKFVAKDGTEQSNRHYNAALRGLAIDLGNNPDVSAVRFHGAQYCVIEDVKIFGEAFNIGVDGLPGSGGSTTNLTITGGKVGIRQDNYTPAPQLTGLRIINPQSAGIALFNSMGPLTIAGFDYEGPGPAVYVKAGAPTSNVTVIDARMNVTSAETAAIDNVNRDTYLRNAEVKADVIVKTGPKLVLEGQGEGWARVDEYMAVANGQTSMVVDDRAVEPGARYRELRGDVQAINAPEADPLQRHVWDIESFPNHVTADMIDPRAFGATPDDESDDDAPALIQALEQSALSGNAVFLPRGHWHIRSPIEMPGGAAMIGASNTISVIHIAEDWIPDGPTAAIRTADGDQGVTLSHFAILGQEATLRKGTEAQKYITLLHGRSADSTIRSVQFSVIEQWKADVHLAAPVIRFSDSMGGRVYNLGLDSAWRHHEGGSKEEGFALVDIAGTSNPLAFYQLDTEQLSSGPQTQIRDARNIAIYGYKHEPDLASQENYTLLEISNSSDLSFFSSAGIYTLKTPDTAIVSVSESSNYVFANWSRNPRHGQPTDRKGNAQFNWITNGTTSVPAHERNMGLFKQGETSATH